MSGGAEHDLLVGIAGVRYEVVVGADDCVDVDEIFGECRRPGEICVRTFSESVDMA
jgi:hypothetical protein